MRLVFQNYLVPQGLVLTLDYMNSFTLILLTPFSIFFKKQSVHRKQKEKENPKATLHCSEGCSWY